MGTERAKIEDTMKALKENDNIMSKVMAQTDAYDELFERELVKYDAPRSAVAANVSSQSDILSRVRSLHGKLLQTYDVTEWRAATRSHAEAVREAAAHYRLLASGMEQGLTFYSGFTEAVRQLGSDCEAFVEGRRKEKGELEQAVARRAQQAAMAAEHAVASAAAASRAAADQAAAQRAMSEAQAMVDAQRASAAQMQRHHYSEHAAWHASAGGGDGGADAEHVRHRSAAAGTRVHRSRLSRWRWSVSSGGGGASDVPDDVPVGAVRSSAVAASSATSAAASPIQQRSRVSAAIWISREPARRQAAASAAAAAAVLVRLHSRVPTLARDDFVTKKLGANTRHVSRLPNSTRIVLTARQQDVSVVVRSETEDLVAVPF